MIWFIHELEQSICPYAQSIAENRRTLASAEFETMAEVFVLLHEATGRTLTAEIGFRLSAGTSSDVQAARRISYLPEHCRYEQLGPMLFATLETRADDPLTCIRYSRMLDRYGFHPTGPRWVRYETGLEQQVLSYIPVLPKE